MSKSEFNNVSCRIVGKDLLVLFGDREIRSARPVKHLILPEYARIAVAEASAMSTLVFNVSDSNRDAMAILHRLDELVEGEEAWLPVADLVMVKGLTLSVNGEESTYNPWMVDADELGLVGDGALIPSGNVRQGRKYTTKAKQRQIVVPCFYHEYSKDKERAELKMVYLTSGDNRTYRKLFNLVEDTSVRYRNAVDSKGRPVRLDEQTISYTLVDRNTGLTNPIAVFQAEALPTKGFPGYTENLALWEESREVITNGLPVRSAKNGKRSYIMLAASSSAHRTLSPTMIDSQVTLPQDIIDEIRANDPDYVEKLLALHPVEQFWDVLTFGGYLQDMHGKQGIAQKTAVRISLAQTTSIPLGQVRTCQMGNAILPWSEEIKKLNEAYLTTKYGMSAERVLANIQKLQKFWKKNVWDGLSILRASTALRLLKRKNVARDGGGAWTMENIVGVVIQYRYVSGKGMAIVLPDELIDGVQIEGVAWFKGYDLILESDSVKFTWNPTAYCGGILEPEFEFVGIAKMHGNDMIDSQLVNCMSFQTLDDQKHLQNCIRHSAKKVSDEIANIDLARINNGVIAGDPGEDEEYGSLFDQGLGYVYDFLRTVDQTEGRLEEPYVVNGLINGANGMRDKNDHGRLKVGGERWFMMPDVSPWWNGGEWVLTDKVDFLTSRPIYDLLVKDAALKNPGEVWACGVTGPLASYRNPLNRPGEIVFTDGMALSMLPDDWSRVVYGNMRSTIVFSLYTAAANLMGGGDFDGDRCMVIWDNDVLALLRPTDFVLCEVEDKAIKVRLGYESIRDSFANSLCNAGIGLITNDNTTWVDLAHMVEGLLLQGGETVELPLVQVMNYATGQNESQTLAYFLTASENKKLKRTPYKLALRELKSGRKMEDWDKEAATAICNLINIERYLSRKIMSFAEFRDEVAPVLLRACEAASNACRYLQELAINTAKSDVWAFYTRTLETIGGRQVATLQPRLDFEYTRIGVRPSWKRSYKSYDCSLTPMGAVVRLNGQIFGELRMDALKQTALDQDLLLGKEESVRAKTWKPESALAITVDKLVKSYNDKMSRINGQAADLSKTQAKEFRKEEIGRMKHSCQDVLSDLQAKYGLLAVLQAAYTSTYYNADILNGRRMSFVYATMADELLTYVNNRQEGDQVVPLKLVPNRCYGKDLHEGLVTTFYDVETKRTLVLDSEGDVIGRVPLTIGTEGPWQLRFHKDGAVIFYALPRLQRAVACKEVGREIRLVGMKDFGCNSKTIVATMKAKMGAAMINAAANMKLGGKKLSMFEDVFHLALESRTLEDQMQVSCVAVYHGGVRVGSVTRESTPYVTKLMNHGDLFILESKPGQKSDLSMTVKVIDVIKR